MKSQIQSKEVVPRFGGRMDGGAFKVPGGGGHRSTRSTASTPMTTTSTWLGNKGKQPRARR
jgi:hypothetical protein